MLKAYLLTDMAKQYFAGPDKFRARYAHYWLVWEPGRWKVGAPLDETLTPQDAQVEEALSRGDALCFALATKPGPIFLRVGRSIDNDVVINDATVSREHLILTRDAQGEWSVEPTAEGNTFCPEPMVPGSPKRVVSGERVRAGEVMLTFYSTVGFIERLGG